MIYKSCFIYIISFIGVTVNRKNTFGYGKKLLFENSFQHEAENHPDKAKTELFLCT